MMGGGMPGPDDIPIRMNWDAARRSIRIKWLRAGPVTLRKGFFSSDIEWIRENNTSAWEYLTEGKEALQIHREKFASKPPAAFLFHISHCGSTLTSRLFHTMPGTISLSEPLVLNQALMLQKHIGAAGMKSLLRQLVPILGYSCMHKPSEEGYVVKFSSWCVLHIDLIKAAFPEVPCIFIYRDPREVLPSLFRVCAKRGGLFRHIDVVKEARATLGFPDWEGLSFEAECAQLLETFFRQFWASRESFAHVLEYPSIKSRIIPLMEEVLKQKVGPDEMNQLRATMAYNAKRKGKFEPDSSAKQKALTAEMEAMVEKHCWPHYARIQEWWGNSILR